MQIKHALEDKLGKGAVSKFAKMEGYSVPYISQLINGDRRNVIVLRKIATFLKRKVYGVLPEY